MSGRATAMLASLRDRWGALGERDRRALRLCGVVLALLLPLLLAWTVDDWLDGRRSALAESSGLAARASSRIAARLGAGAEVAPAPVGDAMSARATVARHLERSGLAGQIVMLHAVDAGRVQLVLRDAPFEGVTLLIGSLARWEGVTVVEAEISRTGSGRVEASLLLRGP